MNLKKKISKSLLSAALAAATSGAFAGDYYITVPVPGKAVNVSAITVALATVGRNGNLPGAVAGQPYAGYDLKPLLTVSGDPNYTGYGVRWTVISGALPAGLVLNSNGTISGTPTAVGLNTFTVRAEYKTKGGERLYRITVLQLTVALAPATPPDAVVGTPFSFDLKQQLSLSVGSSSDVTWTVVSSSLPEGLSLRTDGTIAGTPVAVGIGSLTARATYKTATGEQTYQIVALDLTVGMAPAQLPPARVSTSYQGYDFRQNLTVTGDPKFSGSSATFSATGLPAGMALSSSGTLTGAPAAKSAGTSFNVVATYKSKTGQQVYTLVVKGQYIEAIQVSTGESHTCAVTTGGGVKCWGANGVGQLGVPGIPNSPTPVDVTGLASGVAKVFAANSYSCALTTAGGVKCWGHGSYGQLGYGSLADSAVPVAVTGLSTGVLDLALAYGHACAVLSYSVQCWGWNAGGQLGDGTTITRTTPVPVAGLAPGVRKVGGGFFHSCALTSAGGVKCWGGASVGQLGNGGTSESKVPVDVSGLTSGVSTLSVGNYHACAVNAAGAAVCWGQNTAGQLGNGSTSNSLVPTSTGLNSNVTAVAAGWDFTCAQLGGNVMCWGGNSKGQLGNGGYVGSTRPQDSVLGLPGTSVSISAGVSTACAVLSTNAVYCWGNGDSGQLGNGSNWGTKSAPVQVLD